MHGEVYATEKGWERIIELENQYKEKYNTDIDYTKLYSLDGINQRKLIKSLELMVEQNVSAIEAYKKLFDIGKKL